MRFARPSFYAFWVSISCCWLAASASLFAAPNDEQLRHFETKVRPLLIAQCGRCHGADKQEAKLRLDQPEAIARGGQSGPALVPGKPDESLLIVAVRYQDENLQMPPEKRLSPDEITQLVEWVRQGAALPGVEPSAPKPLKTVDEALIAQGRQFWAFQPPHARPLPAVRQREWPQAPLDIHILAQLERADATPVRRADRLTLLRRATFDLTGLPPTPDAVQVFVDDDAPDAFARLVDRLLASPRYGERWARHWLDIARYADSNGLDENVAHGNAWRYRDYVVTALNRDKPYDEFVREQLAGDLLPSGDDWALRNERLIATGYLALGPKVLAEVDEKKMEMDIVDEQIDTLGRSLLGLTLGCCRCHDHKFDPIGTNDYYALAGIFKSTRTMEHFKKVARWHENPLPTPELVERRKAHDQLVAEKKTAIERVIAQEKAALEKSAEAAKPADASKPTDAVKPAATKDEKQEKTAKQGEAAFRDAAKAELKRLREELATLEKAAPEFPTAMGVTESQIADVPIHVRGSHLSLGQVVPRHFPRVLETTLSASPSPSLAADHSGRLELANWLVRPDHPLTGRVLVNRLWRWHFGQGIVTSTDNFGQLGQRPTHPELLDDLTMRFVGDQWSVKALHRTLVLSATYQLDSRPSERLATIDPENKLYGRANVRRLEAEAIRDALLFASGSLDLTMGGSLLHVKNREYLFDHTSKDGTKYDSPRRSVYLPVIRNNLYDVFQLFDYSDASILNGNRDSTTVAPQALFMLNSALVTQAATQFAQRLLADQQATDEARVTELYLRTVGREPRPLERQQAVAFLSDVAGLAAGGAGQPADARQQAWSILCQSLLSSNEFIYVR